VGESFDLRAAGSELERVRDLAQAFAAQVRCQFGPRARRLRLFGSAARRASGALDFQYWPSTAVLARIGVGVRSVWNRDSRDIGHECAGQQARD